MNTNLLSKLDDLKTSTQTSMQSHPMRWFGIAAGAGLAIGLAGRLIQRRVNRSTVDLFVIESAC